MSKPDNSSVDKDKIDVPQGSDKTYFPEWQMGDPGYSPAGDDQPIDSSVDFTNATNDLSKKAKVTLGSYLSAVTKNNSFPVSKISQLDGSVNARGGSLSIPESNKQSVFAESDNVGLRQTGLGVPKSDFGTKPENRGLTSFFTGEQIKSVLDKSGGDPEKSGHNLLSSIPAENYKGIPFEVPGSTGITLLNAIYNELVDSNMYNPYTTDKSFIQSAGEGDAKTLDDEAAASRGLFTLQRNLGSFDRTQSPITTKYLSERVVSMLAASPTNDSKYKAPENSVINLLTDNQISRLSSQYPWKLQGETKSPPLQDWSSGRLFSVENFSGRDLPRAQVGGALDLASQCYLQLLTAANNIKSELQFIKKNRFVALNDKQVGLSTLFISDTPDTSLLTYGQRESRRYWNIKLSSNRDTRDQNIDYTFERSFIMGVSLFFGLEGRETVLPNLSDIASSPVLNDSSGYYLTIFRSLSVQPPFEGRALQQTDNTENFKSYTKDRRSKIYKFVMTLVALGDVAFKSEIGMRDVTPSERMLTKTASRYISPSLLALPVVVASNLNQPSIMWSAAGSGLLGTFRQHVSRWSVIGSYDAAPSANPLSLHTFLAATKTPPGVGSASTAPIGMRAMTPSRENVELIENALESEYMPFYMHDLRTHEIISMPAFITGFSESFNVSYNPVTGFGRQDPVRLYQSTERTVTFSFIIASFSEEDFDHMWLTINKLVSMCYPQYSAGRSRQLQIDNSQTIEQAVASNNFENFIQPFSQVPAASPMIRLRLGDVFKSNYSKFGLARLFGQNSTANIKNTVTGTAQLNNQILESASTAKNYKTALALTAAKAAGSALNVAYAETDLGGTVVSNFLYDEGTPSQRIGNYISNTQANDLSAVVKVGVDSAIGSSNTAATLPSNQNTLTQAIEGQGKRRTFFDSNSNSIVRSFESTRGRGVAGFITSLALDYEGSTWETKFGKKAPKMVKVSVGFTPINDLPLGLDYDGYMRNPSHPVGRFAGSYGDVYDDIRTSTENDKISVDDFNKSTIRRKILGGQVVADAALGAAFALDDNITKKP